MGDALHSAADWWIDYGFPKLAEGAGRMNKPIEAARSDWAEFLAELAKTDAAESWVTILENLAKFGHYIVTNIDLGGWFNQVGADAKAASGWAGYFAEAVAWIARTVARWSKLLPGVDLPDVESPPSAPHGGGGGGGGGLPSVPAPPSRGSTPAPGGGGGGGGGGAPAPAPSPPPAAPAPPPVFTPQPPATPPPSSGGLPQVGVVPQWGQYITAASALTSVPPSVIAAIMDIETGGHPPWESPMNRDAQGRPIGRAQGLM